MSQTLYLLDGTALAYRSHFAFARSGLSTEDGRPTGAVYGYTTSLLRLLEQASPDLVAVAFDGPEKTFRHAIHKDYKATREKTPDELVAQFAPIKEITTALGLALVEMPGVEADDLIGTLATRGAAMDLMVQVVSGDKDFAQLVGPRVHIYNIFSRQEEVELLDPAGVEKKWGVPPERFADYLALIGDTSDNIPGLPGVGPKTAVELLATYGDLAGVLEQGTSFRRAKVAETIAGNRETALLARRLVAIERDLELPLAPTDLVRRPPDRSTLKRIYGELGFTSLLAELAEDSSSQRQEQDYRTVIDAAGLEELARTLEGATGGFALDTETTSLDAMSAVLVGISFSVEPTRAWYVPFNQGGREWRDEAVKVLAPILADPELPKWGQNIKYDLIILERAGLPVAGVEFDTMLASYCLAPEDRSHGLDALALKYLDYRKIPTEEIIGKGRKQVTMDQVAIPVVAEYACEDADFTGRLVQVFRHDLAESGREELFRQLEMPLVPVLARMEMAGVTVDRERLAALSGELGERLQGLQEKAFAMAGREFNPRSPQQVAEILFDDLEIHKLAGGKPPKKTKTGKYSTNASVLESLAPHHELPRLLLEHRELSKLKSTYVDALPELINPETGRIHSSFNQAVTATGRLSSSDPNLQNIPIRTEEGRRVRACFIPRQPGWRLLSLDYSQIELRVLAHFSGDPHLVEAFRRDQDIHRRTAALILGKEEDQVTPQDRARAKIVNFGILYGMGPRRLARENNLSVKEATSFIESYFQALGGVKEWLDRTLEEARANQEVTTLCGRHRPLPDILSPHDRFRVLAEHMAINTPIQGSAADIVKAAMIKVDALLAESDWQARLVLQVHDELVIDCPAEEADQVTEAVRTAMEQILPLQVPLKVDAGQGDHWLEAH